jgi:hypothetical protein
LTGTSGQIEWAQQIKLKVNGEFDRVAKAFEEASRKQPARDRLETHAVIAILEEKRMEVMAKTEAGYFIRLWQELRDQVRQMIGGDPRYQAIRARREMRDEARPAATEMNLTNRGLE